LSVFDADIDNFLNRIGQSIFTGQMLDRVWKAFMAFCLLTCVRALEARGFTCLPQNVPTGFRFKLFPQGNPDDYSWFLVQRGPETYELRLSVDSQNLNYVFNSLKLNLDVVLIRPGSIDRTTRIVNSVGDLIAFGECKNYKGFPELVAGFEGQVFELQGDRFKRDSIDKHPIPCCLFISLRGTSIMFKDDYFRNARISLRIYQTFQPSSIDTNNFIRDWF
jgi:hypothetical protein